MSGPSVQIYRYALPLQRPLRMGEWTIERREGLLIRCVQDGFEGWGDVAPLPGFSRERLADAALQLRSLAQPLDNTDWLPSVRAGWEQASTRWSQPPPVRVAINALLTEEDPGALVAAAVQCVHQGYRVLKLKVGRTAVPHDVQRVLRLREAVGPVPRLRLDANQGWDLHEAVAFARGIEGADVEYVEEPLRKAEDLAAFCAQTGLAVALDESLEKCALSEWFARCPRISTLVLKPTLLGGRKRVLALAAQAADAGRRVVISSAFESGVGVLGLARLSAELGPVADAAGLDTYRWLARDVLQPGLPFRDGHLMVSEAVAGCTVDFSVLQEG